MKLMEVLAFRRVQTLLQATMYSELYFWRKRRYVVAILISFGFFNVYALRSNLSIAIIPMAVNSTRSLSNGTILHEPPEFDWDSRLQGYVLSSFFYGYITTQLLGGWISARIGGKRVFGTGIAIAAFLTLLTPLVTNVSVYFLITLRVLTGIFEGVTYPCINALLSKWAPPLERSKLATIGYAGSFVGTLVSLPASAYLASAFGWESIFYVFGAIALFWYIIWEWLAAESPFKDKRISFQELQHFQKSGDIEVAGSFTHPWKDILTSLPVWAIILAHFTNSWGFYVLLTELPTFMTYMFDYDLGKTGFLSALPHLVMIVLMLVSGQLADWLQEKKILTTTQVRKIFTSGAFIANAVFVSAAVLVSSPGGTITCLMLGSGLGAFSWSGFAVNYLDVAPKHASFLLGIGNTFGSLAGILSPILTGYIVTTPTPEEWQTVFFICSGLYIFGSLVYGLFASGELQPWAVEKNLKK